MSWINVLWQDPEEGQVYDVWTEEHGRMINITYMGNNFWAHFRTPNDWAEVTATITHFMPSPEPPKHD